MYRRFPSECELLAMSKNDCAFAFQRQARALREEREGILSGYIMPWNGATRAGLLHNNRRRWQRLEKVAAELGYSDELTVCQPMENA